MSPSRVQLRISPSLLSVGSFSFVDLDGRSAWSNCTRWSRNLVSLVLRIRRPAVRGMDGCGHDVQLNVVRSRRRSVAGCLTVLKNNFAGTQAAEMGEDPPLTYF